MITYFFLLSTSLLCLFSVLLAMFELQKYASNKHNMPQSPLLDLLHHPDLIFMVKYYTVSDYVIYFYIASLILFFNQYLYVFVYQLSFIYLFRSISFSITILPKCGKMKDKDNNRSSFQILYDYLSLSDKHTGHNNDLLFSGHSSFMLLYVLYLSYFSVIPLPIVYLLHFINFILSILNILSRCHYSIDVLYAYIVTIFIFQNTIGYLDKLIE